MAKSKKKNSASADVVYAKKGITKSKQNPFATATPATAVSSRKLNPFEVHINRAKFQIIGRTCKHDKGLPGVSRAKAIQKRAETLGQEFRQKHKTNQFRDKRIGRDLEGDQLNEDVLSARFVAEKLSQLREHGKASRFNLNDDEILTHRGQTLEEIEQFHDDRSDDENMDNESLDAEFTKAAHFGGDDANARDRKSAIEDMITEQKRRKVDIAKEKVEVYDLTKRLDSNYKDLIGLVGKLSKSEMKAKAEPDDYDKMLREMVFEPRGDVADKLLSEEDQAKKEKERLEGLEQDRLRRMNPDGEEESVTQQQPKHRSADELDDGYFAYEAEEEEDNTLTYNLAGELRTKVAASEDSASDNVEMEDSAGDETDGGEESSENDDENEADDLFDLKAIDSESEAGPVEDTLRPTPSNLKINGIAGRSRDLTKDDGQSLIPFVIEMPTAYAEFELLLAKRSSENQAVIVERLIKCNHPQLDGVNRENVGRLFTFLLEYINKLFADATQENVGPTFETLDKLSPHLYDLIHLNPEKMSLTLLDVIKEKYAEYRKNSRSFPPLETAIFFKLVSKLFTTSDFRHPIVTPCYIFIQHILSKAVIRTREDVAMGLFLVTIILEYSQLSKRFLPAAFNFLLGIVFLSVPKRSVEILKTLPPFPCQGPLSKILTITEKPLLDESTEELLLSEDLVMMTFTPAFKVRALNSTLKLIEAAIAGDNIGSNYFAEPLLDMLERLPIDLYPECIRMSYTSAMAALKAVAARRLTKLVPPEKKPRALRLLEPRFETVYDDKRRPKVSQAKEDRLKLLHRVKRETKGAVREIRKDTEFLQNMRIKQQIKSDAERKEKVRRIYAEASVQQGELNELARLKKKKKF